MTLILAVEPDSRQASRLASVLRGRRHTEVVVAESADEAIEIIAGRVPDVLLTSPLLVPQDESRLAEWLKELGPAATHVQALTIPILASKTTVEPPPRGLLSGLRRRAKQGPQGCEPKIFAEHVAAYLEKAIVERVDDTPSSYVALPVVPEPASSEPVMPEALAPESPVLEPAMLFEAIADQTPDGAIAEVAIAMPSEAEQDEGLWLLTRSPQVIEFTNDSASGGVGPLPLGTLPLPEERVTLPAEVMRIAALEVVFELPEVITVRDEIDAPVLHRAVAPAPPQMQDELEPDTDGPARAVQDEWGLFDPSKCGFSALLAKLDAITDGDKLATNEDAGQVRLITHY
jgi:CheY-like chemotaxis protein